MSLLIASFSQVIQNTQQLILLKQQIESLGVNYPQLKVLFYPLSYNQVLIWFSVNEINQLLLSRQLTINGSTVTFIDPSNVPNRFVSLFWSKDCSQSHQEMIAMKLKEFYHNCPIFARPGGLFLQFPDSTFAQKQVQILNQSLIGPNGTKLCDLKCLNVSDSDVLVFSWQPVGGLTWDEICFRVFDSTHSITSLLQELLVNRLPQPCVLHVEADSLQGETGALLFVLVPSQLDSMLMKSVPEFEFLQGRLSLVDHSREKPCLNVHIVWNFDRCPLEDMDTPKIVSANIDKMVHLYLATTRLISGDLPFVNFDKLLLLGDSNQTMSPITTVQLQLLSSQEGYQVHRYSSFIDPSLILRSHADRIGQMESSHVGPFPSLTVFITNNASDCASAVTSMKLQGIEDLVLILKETTDIQTPLAKQILPWKKIKFLHTVPDPEQLQWALQNNNQFDRTNGPFVGPLGSESRTIAAPQFDFKTLSISPESKEQFSPTLTTEISNESYVAEVNLRCMSLATHFKQLVEWNREAMERSDQSPIEGISDAGDLKEHECTPEYWSEHQIQPEIDFKQRKYFLFGPSGGERGGDLGSTTVSVNIDSKSKHYSLRVRSFDQESLKHRLAGLEAMYEMMLRNRKTYPMSMWDPQHRECMMGSQILHDAERKFEAGALFHLNDGVVVLAEIVALTAKKHRNMRKFLEDLIPRTVRWSLPLQLVNKISDKKWNHIKHAFAIKIESPEIVRKPSPFSFPLETAEVVTFRCWGFGNLLDEALEYLKSQIDVEEIALSSASTIDLTFPSESFRDVLSPRLEIESKSDMPTSPHAFQHSGASKHPLKSTKVVQGNFSFQDREAGIYFRAFEEEFKSYIESTFEVQLSEIANQESLDTPKASTPRTPNQDQMRAAAIRIEFTGKQPNVNAARAYFDQLNTTTLARFQIFFPVADISKYQAINKQKIHHDRLLKTTRLEALTKNEVGSQFTPVDPLKCVGFVNIRVKPPLHSRGMKRMIFPTDIMVTICGPMATEDQSRIMQELEKAFSEIKSDHPEAIVKVPSNNLLAQTLTVRTSRQKFIDEHKLVSLRWEEGNKTTGNIGTARIWARTQSELDSVVCLINEYNVPESEIPEAEIQPIETQTPLISRPGIPDLTQLELSPLSCDELESPPSRQFVHEIETNLTHENHPLTMIPISPPLPPLPPPQPQSQTSSHAISSSLIGAQSAVPFVPKNFVPPLDFSPIPTQIFVPVCWPNPFVKSAIRFGPAKEAFSTWLFQLSSYYPLEIDPIFTKPQSSLRLDLHNVCVILRGREMEAQTVGHQIADYLLRLSGEIRCLEFVLSVPQFQFLTNPHPEKAHPQLQEFESTFGVAFFQNGLKVLSTDPPSIDTLQQSQLEPLCSYDFRFNDQLLGYGLHEIQDSLLEPRIDLKERELVSMRVRSHHFLENDVQVSVLKSTFGWSWSVPGLLILLDRWTQGSTPEEENKLSQGEVLVSSDKSGKFLLRVRPDFNVANSIKAQAESFLKSLVKGLQTAESLQLRGIAINCSTDLSTSFTFLPNDIIQSITIENVVRFSNKTRVRYLKKIICVEEVDGQRSFQTGSLSPFQGTTAAPESFVSSSSDSLLVPGLGDRMCLSLFVLFERTVLSRISPQSPLQPSQFSKIPIAAGLSSPTPLSPSSSANFVEHQLSHCAVPFPISLSRKLQTFTLSQRNPLLGPVPSTTVLPLQIPVSDDLSCIRTPPPSFSSFSSKKFSDEIMSPPSTPPLGSPLLGSPTSFSSISTSLTPLSSEVRILVYGLKQSLISSINQTKTLLH